MCHQKFDIPFSDSSFGCLVRKMCIRDSQYPLYCSRVISNTEESINAGSICFTCLLYTSQRNPNHRSFIVHNNRLLCCDLRPSAGAIHSSRLNFTCLLYTSRSASFSCIHCFLWILRIVIYSNIIRR